MCVSPWPSQPSDLGFEVGKPARWRKISTPTAARDTGRPWLGWLCEYRALCLLPNCPNMKPDSHATGGSAARRSPVLSWMIQHRRAYWSQPFSTHSNASVGCCVLPKVKWFLKELLATRSGGGGGEKERETRQRGRRRRDKKKRESVTDVTWNPLSLLTWWWHGAILKPPIKLKITAASEVALSLSFSYVTLWANSDERMVASVRISDKLHILSTVRIYS